MENYALSIAYPLDLFDKGFIDSPTSSIKTSFVPICNFSTFIYSIKMFALVTFF